jgi:spore germination cell wall hydrolase CwlJ-like protein
MQTRKSTVLNARAGIPNVNCLFLMPEAEARQLPAAGKAAAVAVVVNATAATTKIPPQ